VIIGFVLMRYRESKGHLPFMKAKAAIENEESANGSSTRGSGDEKAVPVTRTVSDPPSN